MGKNTQAPDGEVHVEYMPLADLAARRWSRNPKRHKTDELLASFDRFGYVSPPTINEATGTLVAGHGRVEGLMALKELGKAPPSRVRVENGDWLVPVLRGIAFDDDREAEAYAIADNSLVELGGWNDEELLAIIGSFTEADYAGTGFTPDDLDRLVSAAVLEGHDVDRFAEEAAAFTGEHGSPAKPHEDTKTRWVWVELPTDEDKERVSKFFGGQGARELNSARVLAAVEFLEQCIEDGVFGWPEGDAAAEIRPQVAV